MSEYKNGQKPPQQHQKPPMAQPTLYTVLRDPNGQRGVFPAGDFANIEGARESAKIFLDWVEDHTPLRGIQDPIVLIGPSTRVGDTIMFPEVDF